MAINRHRLRRRPRRRCHRRYRPNPIPNPSRFRPLTPLLCASAALLAACAGQSPQTPAAPPTPTTLDAATVQNLREAIAKGGMPPMVLTVANCKAEHERLRKQGVEFTQDPIERYGTVDASFRDPSGNGWKMIQSR